MSVYVNIHDRTETGGPLGIHIRPLPTCSAPTMHMLELGHELTIFFTAARLQELADAISAALLTSQIEAETGSLTPAEPVEQMEAEL